MTSTRGNFNTKQLLFRELFVGTLIYSAVLGFFNDYTNIVYTKSFSSLFLASIILEMLTYLALLLKRRIVAPLKVQDGAKYRVLTGFIVWLIMFLSKFMFIWVIDLVFGDYVNIHGFFGILLVVLTVTVIHKLALIFFMKLGDSEYAQKCLCLQSQYLTSIVKHIMDERVGRAFVERGEAEVRNIFLDIELPRGLGVVVPSLVRIEGEELTQVYGISVVRHGLINPFVQLQASYIPPAGEQAQDQGGELLAAAPFYPRKGKALDDRHLPPVLDYMFGHMETLMGEPVYLKFELSQHPEVGVIFQR